VSHWKATAAANHTASEWASKKGKRVEATQQKKSKRTIRWRDYGLSFMQWLLKLIAKRNRTAPHHHHSQCHVMLMQDETRQEDDDDDYDADGDGWRDLIYLDQMELG